MTNYNDIRVALSRFRKVFAGYPRAEEILTEMERHYHFGCSQNGAEAFLLMGPPGSGKTRLEDQFVNRIRKAKGSAVVERNGISADPLHVLQVDAPTDARIKAMAERMLEALGDPNPNKGTQEQMNRRIENLIELRQVSAVCIDETQHFIDRSRSRPRFAYDVADWIKERLNAAQCPLFLIGLESADVTVRENAQLERRVTNRQVIEPIGYSTKNEQELYQNIMESFQDAMELPEDSELNTPDMAQRFHYATGGLVGNTFILADLALRDTLLAERSRITKECLATVFARWSVAQFRQVNPFAVPEAPVFKPQNELDLLEREMRSKTRSKNLLAA